MIKFKFNAGQQEIFDRLTIAQKQRLLQVLELKEKTGTNSKVVVIKDTKDDKTTKIIQDDAQDIVNQYQDRLI